MSNVPRITKGSCRCGQVEFEIASPPLITMACHCTGCQKMTSSAFSLSSLFPSAAFSVTAGEPVIGGLHGSTRHFFCGHCMSWLFTRPDGMDDFVNVRSTLLDGSQSFQPFLETYTAEKLTWAVTGAKHSFSEFPPQEEFPELLQEYASENS
ncbi:GFA family protein [Microbulbifer harenosus]|uniref:GFA family protein n=1 Tax=Microbulbifer harenosus TaxID=2576840 RepID=A0ABY2UIA7_9GAMM|nr:GFA family protein [Microbulbifer harenosus]